MSEQNKALVRRFFEEVWNGRNLAAIDGIFEPNYVAHGRPPSLPPGPEGLKRRIAMTHAAFPDGRMTVEDQIAEGDIVVTRWTARGSHQGEYLGAPPTGRQVTIHGVDIDRIAGGRIVESWDLFDQWGLMGQLGVVPSSD
jgi:predicted ester cyclase